MQVVTGDESEWYVRAEVPWVMLSGETTGGALGYDPERGHGYRGGGSVVLDVFENTMRRPRSQAVLFEDKIFNLKQSGQPGEPPYHLLLE